jgi:uncharacterized protein (TIGR00299 family) protein
MLRTLPLDGWALRQETVFRHAIAATRVHVELTDTQDHVHRHLRHVVEILEAGQLPPRALQWAKQVFERLAEAEAAAHRTTIERVHFHEVGAVDAMIDIAGACTGLHLLSERHDIDAFRTSQIRVGRGTVETQHGRMPVPAPATLRLLEGFPIQFNESDGERVTPTGAALLAALATPLGQTAIHVERTGYGAGQHEFADAANVLRVLLCRPDAVSGETRRAATGQRQEIPDVHTHAGQVAVLRTSIDDMVPEFYGHLTTRLFEAGALDVHLTPVQMKKGRPATEITVVAQPEQAQDLSEVLLTESTTLGVRIAYEDRIELPRRIVSVETVYGDVEIKLATRPDGSVRSAPEYESVRRVAEKAGVPLADVYRAALRADLPEST